MNPLGILSDILEDKKLCHEHVMNFHKMLINQTTYRPRVEFIGATKPVDLDKKYIEIIKANASDEHYGLCLFYDIQRIFIYDPSGSRKLCPEQTKYVTELFPCYDFKHFPVVFPEIDLLSNSNDGGVLAIVYATSLVLGLKPDNPKIFYDQKRMRHHLLNILLNNNISAFPQDNSRGAVRATLSLELAVQREKYAEMKRKRRKINENSILNDDLKHKSAQCNTGSTACIGRKPTLDSQHDKSRSDKAEMISSVKCNNQSVNDFSSTCHSDVSLQRNEEELRDDCSLTSEEAEIIINNDLLLNSHMDKFNNLLQRYTSFSMQNVALFYFPESIIPVSPNEKHVQILYRSGHWICSYYDAANLWLYDSLNQLNYKKLPWEILVYLRKLYPWYFNDRGEPIKEIFCPRVQHQGPTVDCGLFSISNAMTVVAGGDPSKVTYDQSRMRNHLLELFRERSFKPFPTIESEVPSNKADEEAKKKGRVGRTNKNENSKKKEYILIQKISQSLQLHQMELLNLMTSVGIVAQELAISIRREHRLK